MTDPSKSPPHQCIHIYAHTEASQTTGTCTQHPQATAVDVVHESVFHQNRSAPHRRYTQNLEGLLNNLGEGIFRLVGCSGVLVPVGIKTKQQMLRLVSFPTLREPFHVPSTGLASQAHTDDTGLSLLLSPPPSRSRLTDPACRDFPPRRAAT